MRVISGKYKGQKIKGYNQVGTRPTMDRVKESLFSMIQTKIKNSTVLDLFAGSGSLGIEALSNGSKKCYFVEVNKKMFLLLKTNLETIKITEEYYLFNLDYLDFLKLCSKNKIKFDLIFLDPPYNLYLINQVLEQLIKYNLLKKDGQVICEYTDEKVENHNFKIITEKNYGNKKIRILEKRN